MKALVLMAVALLKVAQCSAQDLEYQWIGFGGYGEYYAGGASAAASQAAAACRDWQRSNPSCVIVAIVPVAQGGDPSKTAGLMVFYRLRTLAEANEKIGLLIREAIGLQPGETIQNAAVETRRPVAGDSSSYYVTVTLEVDQP